MLVGSPSRSHAVTLLQVKQLKNAIHFKTLNKQMAEEANTAAATSAVYLLGATFGKEPLSERVPWGRGAGGLTNRTVGQRREKGGSSSRRRRRTSRKVSTTPPPIGAVARTLQELRRARSRKKTGSRLTLRREQVCTFNGHSTNSRQ